MSVTSEEPSTSPSPKPRAAAVSARSGAGRPAQEPFRWGLFLTYLTSFCVIALLIGAGVAFFMGLRPLEARAEQIVSSEPHTITIQWPPVAVAASADAAASAPPAAPRTWLPTSDQQSLMALAQAALDGDGGSLSPDPIARVATAMQQSGWFDGSPSVRRERGNSIIVSGAWRIPAAVVRSGGKDHLISWNAMPMPASYEPGEARLPMIVGPALPRPMLGGTPDFSSAWPGEDIAASLELLRLTATQPWFDQVSGIDASRFSGEQTLVILTKWNTRLVWGGRPSRPRIGEVSTRQKLVNIAQLHHDSQRIDSGYPEIQVFGRWLLLDNSAGARAASEAATTSPAEGGTQAVPTPQAEPGQSSPAPAPAPRGPTTLVDPTGPRLVGTPPR
jgi:hypothetical protein